MGPDTVNTLSLKTLDAYHDHGNPGPRLTEDMEGAHWKLDHLANVDLNIRIATRQPEEEGVNQFVDSCDDLLTLLQERVEG
jgi:transaldolase